MTKYIVSYSIDGGYFEFQTREPSNFPRVSYKLVGFPNLQSYRAEKEKVFTQNPKSFVFALVCFCSLLPHTGHVISMSMSIL